MMTKQQTPKLIHIRTPQNCGMQPCAVCQCLVYSRTNYINNEGGGGGGKSFLWCRCRLANHLLINALHQWISIVSPYVRMLFPTFQDCLTQRCIPSNMQFEYVVSNLPTPRRNQKIPLPPPPVENPRSNCIRMS